MNSEEQTLIDGLFSKLKSAETGSAPRDVEAEARIKEHLNQQPAAPYYMAQAILVQEAAVNQLNQQVKERDEQIQRLQAELQQAKAQGSSAPAQGGGGFLSSIFGGGGNRPQSQPQQSFSQPPASSGGGWRDGGPSSPPPYNAPQGNYAAPQQAPRGTGFLGGALQTAAGVAGGVMLAQGLSSMFGSHNQPEEVVEVIKEEPAQVADHSPQDSGGGWNDNQESVTSKDSYGSDQGGWDDGGFDGGDDDSFV
ncbi:putative periplasmic ligand-binding sensor protein [Pseudomonas savastanoi pv. glycinea]|nr:putative periplasmic ligand-binding sensor protein [Pseudomonas savastanoi pv. glycinea]